jgi:predicted enzyme related to lactoylglutathione lyase
MTMYAPGMPVWVELSTTDLAAATRFYCELFGWTSRVAEEPEAGGYTTFLRDGKAVAAAGPVMDEAQPTAWLSYFGTADTDATSRQVEQAGGKVLAAPFDVMGYGRMAVFADPAGAVFAVWQAGTMPGLEVKGEPGSLSWNELMTRDPAAGKEFYPAVLGWRPRDLDMGDGMTYTLWEVGGDPAGGMMPIGDEWPADMPSAWTVYIEVDDTDAVVAKCTELGGSVAVPATDSPAGRFASLVDPQGGVISVIKSDPNFQP